MARRPSPALHLVLLGLMGVGKSTVGGELVARLGWPLSDSDEQIQERYGATVRELAERRGAEGMHQLEAEHLLGALAEPSSSVICAAASVIDDERCRSALTEPSAFTVWLQGEAATLAERFATGAHRPVFGPDPVEVFRHQLGERGARYAELADLRVSVEGRTPDEIAAEILTAADLS